MAPPALGHWRREEKSASYKLEDSATSSPTKQETHEDPRGRGALILSVGSRRPTICLLAKTFPMDSCFDPLHRPSYSPTFELPNITTSSPTQFDYNTTPPDTTLLPRS